MNIVSYAIPVFLFMMVAEMIYSLVFNLHLFTRKDTLSSLGLGIGSTLVSVAMKNLIILAALNFVYQNISPFKIGHEWWAWVLCILLVDFCAYWAHRFGHEVRMGWAAHVPHHSSEYYNLSTALRQSWTHHYFFIFYLPLPLFGFDPAMTFLCNGIVTVYQFWIHTELIGKLGPVEWIFNTPSHHRVHHGANEKYLDKNYGAMLIIWDRIFGTFQGEEEKVVYGLTKNVKSYNLITLTFHEWAAMFRDMARAKSFSDKLKHLFYPPGWQPKEKVKAEAEIASKKAEVV